MPRPELQRPPTPAEAYADRKARRQAREYQQAVRQVLASEPGRRVFAHILHRAGVFHSIWTPSAEIHYRAGRQDFGHELMAEWLEADEELYDLMERENRARRKRDDAEDAAFEQEQSTP
jgi:hypothetical protein